jgi:ABC-type multidrug transport system permease subunit
MKKFKGYRKDLSLTWYITTIAILGLVVAAFIIMWPLALIWALNLVFHLSIPYTFKTWLAILLLNIAVSSTNYRRNNN